MKVRRSSKDTEIEFTLRESVPTDPAIPISPVKLLVEAIRAKI